MSESKLASVVEMKTVFKREASMILEHLDPKLANTRASYEAEESFAPASSTEVTTRVRTRAPEEISKIMKSVADEHGYEVISIETIPNCTRLLIGEILNKRILGAEQNVVYTL